MDGLGFAVRRCGPHAVGDCPHGRGGAAPSMETERDPVVGAGIHGRTGMHDRPPPSDSWEPPADPARLATLIRDLRRALAATSPEDRTFVLGHLEALARRFGDGDAAEP